MSRVTPAVLVGRIEELAVAIDLASGPAGGIVVLGPAGIGKTVFAGAVAEQLGGTVEWIQASHAANGILLGACAHLLDPSHTHATTAALVSALVSSLRDQAAAAPLTLVIDDAHLADGATASVVARVLGAAGIRVILTIRSGEEVPDLVASLDLPKLALQTLSVDEVGRVAASLLSGALEPATIAAMHRISAGNPLFLCELLRGEQEAGRLHRAPETRPSGTTRGRPSDESGRDPGAATAWVWAAGADSVRSLAEVIDQRIGALTEPAERALELLAYSGPAELALLDSLVDPDTLAGLETRGLIVTGRDGRRTAIRIAHPLYDEHLRARTGPLRVRLRCGELIEALERLPGRRRRDRWREALWRLERGEMIEVDTLTAATALAHRSFHESVIDSLARRDDPTSHGGTPSAAHIDHHLDELVERCDRDGRRDAASAHHLARAAWDRSPTFETGLAFVLQQPSGVATNDELLRTLDRLDTMALDPAQRRAVALERAAFEFWRQADPPRAFVTLEAAAAANPSADERGHLLATRAGYALHHGDGATAARLGAEIHDDERLAPYPRVVAAVPAAGGLCLAGRFDEALALADEAVADVLAGSFDDLRVIGDLMYLKVAALIGAGRFIEAEDTAKAVYRLALENGSLQGVSQFGAWLGTIALYRGHAGDAIQHLHQAKHLLGGPHGSGERAHVLGNLAVALALTGDAVNARSTLDRARAAHRMPRFHDSDLALAEAWVLAAEGRREAAAAVALDVAGQAIDQANPAFAVNAADLAARLGHPGAIAVLEQLRPVLDGPLCGLALDRARAVERRDPAALERLAEAYESVGIDLTASECAAAAAAQWRTKGDAARATAALARMRVHLDRCVGAHPPTLLQSPDSLAGLTNREREIVLLAAAGLSSPQIAEQLFVSSRTVETHLYRAFTKLGVAKRSELRDHVAAGQSFHTTL